MSINVVFRVLGRVQILLDGQFSTDWAAPRVRAILAPLLIQPGRPFSRDNLIDWAWGEDEKRPNGLDSTFHTYAGRIRTVLSQVDAEVKLVSRSGYLHLEVDKNLIDYHRFRDLMQQARSTGKTGDHATARDLARAGVDLWQPEGPLFEVASERADNWRRKVRADEWIPANNVLLQELLALGDLDEALIRLNELGEEHAGSLVLMKRRLETLYGLGRADDAKTYYFAARKALRGDNDDAQAEDLRVFHDRLADWDAEPARETANIPAAPAAAAHTSVSQLPPDIVDFVGREILLAKLHEFVAHAKNRARAACVVFDGPPGIGKTAFVVHWAHHELGTAELVDSALYLNLNGFSSGPRIEVAEAVDELLHALDYPVDRLTTPGRRAAKLAELIADRRTVVILDNVQNSAHVRPLIPLISRGTVVVVSRQRLTGLIASYGLSHFTVLPMPQHEAAELLTGRIGVRAAREPHIVDQLAALCGGLPLALQLVANHIDTDEGPSLPDYVSELGDRTRLLDIGDDGDDPDASLRASFSLSYRALPQDQQRLFRLLSLHPGEQISPPAAAALTGDDVRTTRHGLDILAAAHLIDRSYRCHDLLRTFAADLAAAEGLGAERDAAQSRLLSFYLHTTFNSNRQLFPHRTPVPMPDLEAGVTPVSFTQDDAAISWVLHERPNIVAVLRWAVSLGRHDYVWRMPHNIYGVYRRYGYYDELSVVYEMAVNSVRICGEIESEGATRNDLGYIYLLMGDFLNSSVQLHTSANIAQQANSAMGIAVSQFQLANLDQLTGKLDQAVGLYRRALDGAKNIGARSLQSAILHQIGETFQKKGQFGEAVVEYQQALHLRDGIGNHHGQAETLTELGAALAELGDYTAAQAYCQRALGIVEEIHDIEEAPRTCLVLAGIHHRRRDNTAAVRYARTAARLALNLRNAPIEAAALDVLAQSQHDLALWEEARENWERARVVYADLGRIPLVHRIDADLAELKSGNRAVPQARKAFTPGWTRMTDIHDRRLDGDDPNEAPSRSSDRAIELP
ncbi:MAG TPA: tetratricopeptide repeat protein [Pseudonocardiaceae bacterium]|nr:tetratricopeptide repeat protein [Pseudonocardiaceae bacterium]